MSRRKGEPMEATEFAGMMRRLIRSYGQRVGEADYVDLADLVAVQAELDKALVEAVRAMRERPNPVPWSTIALGLGTTRQAAQQRFTPLLSAG